MRRVVWSVAVVAALAWSAVSAVAQPTVTGLGTLGGAWSEADGINDGGQITGASHIASHEEHACLWSW